MLFYSIEADKPAESFSMEFSQVRAIITGRNLEVLFRLVCNHRVAEITEADHAEEFARGDNEPVVQRIDFKSTKGDSKPCWLKVSGHHRH